MADLSKYSDDVLKKLIRKMEIEDENKSLDVLELELENWENLLPTISIKELNELKDYLEYEIYDLFNIKKLPTKYREWFDGRDNKNNGADYIDYYYKLDELSKKFKIKEIQVKMIKKSSIEM